MERGTSLRLERTTVFQVSIHYKLIWGIGLGLGPHSVRSVPDLLLTLCSDIIYAGLEGSYGVLRVESSTLLDCTLLTSRSGFAKLTL